MMFFKCCPSKCNNWWRRNVTFRNKPNCNFRSNLWNKKSHPQGHQHCICHMKFWIQYSIICIIIQKIQQKLRLSQKDHPMSAREKLHNLTPAAASFCAQNLNLGCKCFFLLSQGLAWCEYFFALKNLEREKHLNKNDCQEHIQRCFFPVFALLMLVWWIKHCKQTCSSIADFTWAARRGSKKSLDRAPCMDAGRSGAFLNACVFGERNGSQKSTKDNVCPRYILIVFFCVFVCVLWCNSIWMISFQNSEMNNYLTNI